MEKNVPDQHQSKESLSNYIDFRHNRLQNKKNNTGEKGALRNNKGSTLYKYITILNVYVPSERQSKYSRQKVIELKREIDKSTVTAGAFDTLLLVIGRCSIQRGRGCTDGLNIQLDLIGICRMLHTITEYTFFSSSDETSTKIDHILGHKRTFKFFKKQKSDRLCSQLTINLNQK